MVLSQIYNFLKIICFITLCIFSQTKVLIKYKWIDLYFLFGQKFDLLHQSWTYIIGKYKIRKVHHTSHQKTKIIDTYSFNHLHEALWILLTLSIFAHFFFYISNNSQLEILLCKWTGNYFFYIYNHFSVLSAYTS